MKAIDLTVRDADDFLERLYGRLRRQDRNFSLLEPALLVLHFLRESGASLYLPHRDRFAPIVIDALLSGACESFGYDGLVAAGEVAGDLPLISDGYIPESIAKGLEEINRRLEAVEAALAGALPTPDAPSGGRRGKQRAAKREQAEAEILLPLVSIYRIGDGTLGVGRVLSCRVTLRITGEVSIRKRLPPVVTFKHIFAEPDDPFERQAHTAIAVAERIAAAGCGSRLLARLPREYRISLPQIAALPVPASGIMSGASAGLAFAMLFLTAICRLDLGRTRLGAAGETAFTGEIDGSGAVLPVSDSLIGEKVRAVFFSPCRRLVVPRCNLPAAERELALLARRHPRRQLEIVAAGSVAGMLRDPSTIARRRPAPLRAFTQQTFFWRKHLTAAASMLAAVYLSLFVAPPYLDRDVASAKMIDSLVFVMNSHGRRIGTYNTGRIPAWRTDAPSVSRIFTEDIDGSGKMSVVVTLAGGDRRFESHHNEISVIALSHRGHFLRQTRFSSAPIIEQIIHKLSRPPKGLASITQLVADANGNGFSDLYVLTHQAGAPPYLLLRFSLKDTTCDAFLHSGFMRAITVRDLDGDGRNEIVITAYNPDLESPVVIALDPDHIQGASPAGARFKIDGFENDPAKYYIRLPSCDMQLPLNNPDLAIICDLIVESGWPLSVLSRSRGVDIAYHFDENLVCREAHITKFPGSRSGKGHGRRWELRQETDQDPFREHLEELVAGVRYWDGEGWSSEPVINRSYQRLADRRPAGEGRR